MTSFNFKNFKECITSFIYDAVFDDMIRTINTKFLNNITEEELDILINIPFGDEELQKDITKYAKRNSRDDTNSKITGDSISVYLIIMLSLTCNKYTNFNTKERIIRVINNYFKIYSGSSWIDSINVMESFANSEILKNMPDNILVDIERCIDENIEKLLVTDEDVKLEYLNENLQEFFPFSKQFVIKHKNIFTSVFMKNPIFKKDIDIQSFYFTDILPERIVKISRYISNGKSEFDINKITPTQDELSSILLMVNI